MNQKSDDNVCNTLKNSFAQRCFKSLMLAFIACCVSCIGCSVEASAQTTQSPSIVIGPWHALFQGIDESVGSINGVGNHSVATILRVDLSAPGISFFTTPRAGTIDTISENSSQFIEKYKLQAAINANFFGPCCSPLPKDETVIGLAISNGVLVSTPVNINRLQASLLIDKQNHASIKLTSADMDFSHVQNAVTGSAIIVQNGANTHIENLKETDGAARNPRTAVGLSKDGRTLYMLAVDGRQAGYSDGTTLVETADFMVAAGAYTAINLDGGGSTEMSIADIHSKAVLLNRPSGRDANGKPIERAVANHLGVRALPLIDKP